MKNKKIIITSVLMLLLTGCASNKELLAQNQATISQLRNQVVDLKAENEGLQSQLAQAKQTRIPSGVIAVNEGNARGNAYGVSEGTVVTPSQSGSFDNAVQLYRAGDIDGAIREFTNFLNSGAQGEQAAMAQYWVGSGYYTQRNYEQAVKYLGTFLKNMPESDKTNSALSQLITSLKAVGRTEDAQVLEQQGVSAIQ